MIVFGILRDLVNRPIANGLLQIVATSTTNSVFIGSSVYMKANSRGYYQFELLPGTYSLYVQPSKQSDVEYLGETVVTDEMPDGSLNSLVDITVPILPKLVQQTMDAANQAALSASNIERNIERTNVLVIQTSNKANEVKDNLQQMNVLVQTATDNVERIKESLNHSQQIKDDTLGLYNATNFSKQASRQSQLAAKESEDNALESAQQAALEVEQAKAVIRIDIVNAAKSQANRSFQEAERAQSSAQLSQTAKESAQQSVNNALAIKQQVSERIADVELLQQHVQEQVDISARQIELAQHSAVMASENVVVTTEKVNIATQQAGIAEQQAVNALESANNADVSAHLAQVSADVAIEKSDVSIEKAISVSLGLSQTLTAKEAAVEAARRAELAAASLSGAMLEQGGIDLSSGVTPEPLVDINGVKRACFWKVTVAGTVNGIEYGVDDSLVYSASMDTYYKIDNTESVTSINGQRGVVVLSKNDVGLEHVPNIAHTVEANVNSVPVRDNHGDIQARLFSSGFSNQSEFSGALAFRIDNVSDSYIRFCSNQGAIRQWLDTYSKDESDTRYISAQDRDNLASNISPQFSGKVTIEGLENEDNTISAIQLYAKSDGGHAHPIPMINHNDGYDNDSMMYKYKNIFAGSMTYEYLKSISISVDGNANKYIKIATVYIPQNGSTVEIEITGGGGYNVGQFAQCDHNRIIIRSGNGNPKGINCVVYSHSLHDTRFFTQIYTHNSVHDWYDVYLFVVNPYSSQLIFKFHASNGSYVKANFISEALINLPESSQKGRIYKYTYTQDDIN